MSHFHNELARVLSERLPGADVHVVRGGQGGDYLEVYTDDRAYTASACDGDWGVAIFGYDAEEAQAHVRRTSTYPTTWAFGLEGGPTVYWMATVDGGPDGLTDDTDAVVAYLVAQISPAQE